MSTVLNDEDYLQLARDILLAHGDVLTPSQITQKARNQKRYRYARDLSSKLHEVILKSFQKHEGMFFLSLKGKRQFRLCEWQEPLPYLNCVIDELIKRGKDVHQRKDIRLMVGYNNILFSHIWSCTVYMATHDSRYTPSYRLHRMAG